MHLKRFTPEGIKIERLVPFEERLTLGNRHYALSSCVLHTGNSQTGHYVTLYSEAQNRWVLFDDHSIYVFIPDQQAHKMLAESGYIGFYRAIA